MKMRRTPAAAPSQGWRLPNGPDQREQERGVIARERVKVVGDQVLERRLKELAEGRILGRPVTHPQILDDA